ncbi:MAG TPA: protein kinase [Kofleriaceae bacterium]|nr:protein kinase [Kofleriaceae bacterium]
MGRAALIGRTLGDFVIRERIGEGGSATVFRAEQVSLGREVVVKVLRRTIEKEAVARFLREAQLASRFEHPFAAHVYAFGAEPDGVLWIAMELVRGTSLDRVLEEQGPLPIARLASLLDRLCEVIAAAHEQGVVHRDVKPANVIVTSSGGRLSPKLVDFGVALAGIEAGEDVVGSPSYMAPEQWTAPGAVDARADVYALGISAYEALVGTRPFRGETLHELAAMHAKAPVPAVPPSFPSTLDLVFAKALAKDPADRYGSALELAAAFRRAAGLDDTAVTIAIDPSVRARALASAPQPIAEVVGALDAARNPHQARAAIFDVVRAIARWLGALALAGARRLGASPITDGHLLLRRDRLDDGDWLRVARALTAPLADRPAVHPVPELVELVSSVDAIAALEGLIALRAEDEHAPHADVARAGDVVARAAPLVETLLGALAPLFAYDVVVARGGLAEKWTGVRRAPRMLAAARASFEDDRPALVDRDGAAVLALWPLVQARAPAAGMAHELFVIDGSARGGARLIAAPAGFEHVDADAMHALRDAIAGSSDDDALDADARERAPYLGLASFSADDAAYYVGRERDVEAFVNRLRVTPLLVVVGPSGAGKSSFVQAGVAPALGWRTIVTRPGRAPVAQLEARLARENIAFGSIADPLLLVVDQLEELFTLGAIASERQRFVSMLVDAARSAEDPLRVVLCLRDDFLIRAHELAPLRDTLGASLHLLGAPAADDLRRMLEEPARRAGYEYEDAALVAEMVGVVEGRAGALPLLSFTASRIWERRDRAAKILPRAACDAVGGVAGALAQHAEDTLAAMPHEVRALVREAFRHLVTAEGTRAIVTRAELVQLLGRGAESLIEQLVAARLITAGEGEGGGERIEIVHEALIGAWPRVVGWRQEDAVGARLRDQLRAAARQWQERGRPRGLLWRDEALLELELWRARAGALTATERDFADASTADRARGRRVRRTLAIAAMAVVVAGSIAILVQSRKTDRERERAEQRTIDLLTEQGRLALVGGDPLRGGAYVAEAFHQGGDGPLLRFLAARAADALAPAPVRLEHGERVAAVAWSPDGARVVTTSVDGGAALWDARGARIAVLGAGHGEMPQPVFAPGGAIVAIAGKRGIELYDGVSGAARGSLEGSVVHAIAFAPDGARAVSCADDGVRLYDLARAIATVIHAGPARGCAWAGDTIAATGGPRKDAWIAAWSAAGELRFEQPFAGANVVAVAPSGDTIAATGGAIARVIDARTGAPVATLVGHAADLTDLAFAPDGARLATASRDGTARLWQRTGALARTLRGHRDATTSVSFSPDGARVLTTSDDGTARVWDATDGTPVRALFGHTAIVPRGAFSPDGARVATAGWDRSALIWTVRPGWIAAIGGDRPHDMATIAPDGSVIAGGANIVERFDAKSGAKLASLDLGGPEWTWSRDGSVIAAVDHGAIVVRDFPSGTERARFGAKIASIFLRADGRELVAVDTDGHLFAYDDRGARLAAPAIEAHVIAGRVTDDGAFILGYHDRVVEVWDAHGAHLHTLAGHDGHVYDLWTCPGHAIAASVGNDRTARVWDLQRGTLIATLTGHTNVTLEVDFTPDCARVATASSDGTVKIWEVATARALASFDVLADGVTTAHVSPDGARLVSVDRAGRVRVWNIADDARTADDIVAWARCHLPFRVASARLEPATPDPGACR